jgi:hypothetical protein
MSTVWAKLAAQLLSAPYFVFHREACQVEISEFVTSMQEKHIISDQIS